MSKHSHDIHRHKTVTNVTD